MEQKKMVRNIFRCCALLAVAAAIGVYWAADFCKRHPDSAFARYAAEVAQYEQGTDPMRASGTQEPDPPSPSDGPEKACPELPAVPGAGPELPPPEPIDLTALP